MFRLKYHVLSPQTQLEMFQYLMKNIQWLTLTKVEIQSWTVVFGLEPILPSYTVAPPPSSSAPNIMVCSWAFNLNVIWQSLLRYWYDTMTYKYEHIRGLQKNANILFWWLECVLKMTDPVKMVLQYNTCFMFSINKLNAGLINGKWKKLSGGRSTKVKKFVDENRNWTEDLVWEYLHRKSSEVKKKRQYERKQEVTVRSLNSRRN